MYGQDVYPGVVKGKFNYHVVTYIYPACLRNVFRVIYMACGSNVVMFKLLTCCVVFGQYRDIQVT